MMNRSVKVSSGERQYHHGDLRAAMCAQALAVTRVGGPSALSMREVTKEAGVSPGAAYRHFTDRSHLLRAVADDIHVEMATVMRRRMRAPRGASAPQRSLLRLRGVGLGYIAFAIDEPGWFETAFFGDSRDRPYQAPSTAAPAAFALLTSALDDCVQAGALTTERREGAEFSCWSAVHGCAELLIHGPLSTADATMKRRVAARVVDDIIVGVRGSAVAPEAP